MNMVVSLELVRLVFDTGGMILEDKLQVGRRTFLDKIDRDFYETIMSLLSNDCWRYIIPLK